MVFDQVKVLKEVISWRIWMNALQTDQQKCYNVKPKSFEFKSSNEINSSVDRMKLIDLPRTDFSEIRKWEIFW